MLAPLVLRCPLPVPGEGYVGDQPLLSTRTLHLFYGPLQDALMSAASRLQLPKAADEYNDEALNDVSALVSSFHGLVDPSKIVDMSRPFVSQILRMR